MATTAGALSQVSVGSTTAQLSSAAATGGTAPYTYQWYRSTTSGFTPGAGNIIAGATSLTLNDSGLIPNTQYYYKVIATDSGSVAGTSAQLAVATTNASTLGQNQFAQSTLLGTVDLRMCNNTISAQIDASQSGNLYAGQAVKIVDSADGIPKVVACTANSDQVFGFINFDMKTVAFVAGSPCELSLAGNAIYLYATGAIARGAQVQLDVSSPGAVASKVNSSGASIVGYAFDKAPAAGALIRVVLSAPSFQFA
jgi:hypothetical protein